MSQNDQLDHLSEEEDEDFEEEVSAPAKYGPASFLPSGELSFLTEFIKCFSCGEKHDSISYF